MRVVLLSLLVGLSLPAQALQELWHVDTQSACEAYPLVADYDGQPPAEVIVTTRFDGTVRILRADGSVRSALRREYWLDGSVAGTTADGHTGAVLAFQQSNGLVSLLDMEQGLFVGEAGYGAGASLSPCFVDLDGNGVAEVVTTRRDGIVSTLNSQLIPLWVFDAGAPIYQMPAGAPIFIGQGALYVLSADGRLHGLSGQGRPLWHYDLPNPVSRHRSAADPIVAQLAFLYPTVLVSDGQGWLYAVNSVTGREEWRVQAGNSPLGTPAVLDVRPEAGREIVVVSEAGDIVTLDTTGSPVAHTALPRARYVPRPVIADVDGDNQLELVLPNDNWELIVASLEGVVEETIPLQGNVRLGAVLADIQGDGTLELTAATDCGRVYCFATAAKDGWLHPRANAQLNGCVLPIPPTAVPSRPRVTRSAAPDEVVLPEFTKDSPAATAWLHFGSRGKAVTGSAVIRQGEIVLGSATRPLSNSSLTVPYVRFNSDAITLDITLYDEDFEPTASVEGFTVRPRVAQPVPLGAPEPLFKALDERAAAFALPSAWPVARVGGRDWWHVTRFMPEEWNRFGLAQEPFIRDAVPRVFSSAADRATLFAPGHPAWDAIAKDNKPFFVLNERSQPDTGYPNDAVHAIDSMAGGRFLGFPLHEWAYRVWKSRWEGGNPPPATPAEAMAILEQDFKRLMDLCQGRVYEGDGYCLFHHQAFEWGAPMGYVEVGENVPCAPLQFAYLRGAARQYGTKPWGACVSNRYRNTMADARFRPDGQQIAWAKPNLATGPDCGHSPSLEFRLQMAAYLAGATFVHHAEDDQNGSIFVAEPSQGHYELSAFGKSMSTWYQYAEKYPERGAPYTPIAFLTDPDRGWRPRESLFGLWPRERADLSMESIFAHVFPYGGSLDFERGYLAAGPYGDVFDVLTTEASPEVLRTYPVIWPIGRLRPTSAQVTALEEYVRQGGILVIDTALADFFDADFVGARFKDRYAYANQIQTALDSIPSFGAPFRYRPMWVLRGSQVLAHTDDGSPLTVWRREGKGVVIASGTRDWADETSRALPLVPALLKRLVRAFVPVSVEGNAEMLLNKTASGWVVGLINNNGVLKAPTTPAETDPAAALDCVLRFRGMVPLRFMARMGDFRWNATSDGLFTRIQPGEVAVLEVVLAQSAAPAP